MRFFSTLSLYIVMGLFNFAHSFRIKRHGQNYATASDFCNPLGSTTLKKYFFEFKFPDRDYPTAMFLSRDPHDPELQVFEDRTWALYQRDKTAAYVDCSKERNIDYTWISPHEGTPQESPLYDVKPQKCTDDIDGLKGIIVQNCLETKNQTFWCSETFDTHCDGWSWFGQCPKMARLDLVDGRTVYLPKDNVRRAADSKPQGDGWITQVNQSRRKASLDLVHSNEPLYWRAQCAEKNTTSCSSKPSSVIKLRSLASITRTTRFMTDPKTQLSHTIVGVRFTREDGTEQEIVGGIYYPYQTMWHLTYQKRVHGGNKSRDCFNCTQSPGDNFEQINALYLLSEAIAPVFTGISGGITALIAGFGWAHPITGAYSMFNTLRHAYSWLQLSKLRKDFEKTAAEKIWSKMECHWMFKRCGADILVPKEKSCHGS